MSQEIVARVAVYRLGSALEAEGAIVNVCALGLGAGGTKQGLDDFLCEAGVEELKARPHITLEHERFDRARKKAQARDAFGHPTRTPVKRGKKLAELMKKVFPAPRAVVDKVILEGLTLLAGKPKLGKSRLMLDIAIAVACGGKALGHLPVDPGPVLYISLEDPERRLQGRIGPLLADCHAPKRFEYETEWPKVDEGGLDDLELWLAEHPGARLIVIDTLKRLRPKPKVGQNVYDADYEALQGLADLCHRHEGLAIVVVHHTNKLQEAEDFADLISGSTGLPGSVDGFAVMRRVMPWKFLPRHTEIEGDWAWRNLWVNSARRGRSNRNSP
jgi:AAA domain